MAVGITTSIEIEAPEIDRRSFHVFEMQGDRLLFDRATGTTSSLSEIAFHLLRQIRWGTAPADAAIHTAETFPGTDPDELLVALIELQSKGFFRFTPVKPATEEELEGLWTHQPRRIQLLMAEGCNLGCRYCYQWRNGTNQLGTLMPWKVARTAIDYLVWRSAGREELQVTFFGGEPLLNYPMIQRVVEYCRKIEKQGDRRFVFELITNGTLLTPEVTDYLVENRFLLFISLDGWKEMHNYNRPAMDGSDDTHDLIVKHATYANEQYEKHGLQRIKVRANLTAKFHDAGAVTNYLESLGFKTIGVAAIMPLPHGDPSKAALSEEQMDELTRKGWRETLETYESIKAGRRVGRQDWKNFYEVLNEAKRHQDLGITCGVCRNTAVVDNRGNMYPCHRYGEMQAYRIGNVFTGLDRKLVMDYYKRINTHATVECHDCWIRDYCGGGCAWDLSAKDGTIHHPTQQECSRRRRGFKQALYLRKEVQEKLPKLLNNETRESFGEFDLELVGQVAESITPGSAVPEGVRPVPRWETQGVAVVEPPPPPAAGRSARAEAVRPIAISLPVISPGGSCGSGGCGSEADGSGCATCGSDVVAMDIADLVSPTAAKRSKP